MNATGFGWASLTWEIEALLVQALRLSVVRLPPDLARRDGQWKGEPVSIETRAYAGGPIEYARFAVVNGARLQIGNILCLPSQQHPLPILGADLVAVRSDTGMLAIDLSPTLPPGNEREAQLRPLAHARAHHPALPPGGDLPAWCSTWFSPYAVYTRGRPTELDRAPEIVRDFAAIFIGLTSECSPKERLATQVARSVQGYIAAHRSDDKGLNLLGKMFGAEWATRYVSRVLFPDMPLAAPGIDVLATST